MNDGANDTTMDDDEVVGDQAVIDKVEEVSMGGEPETVQNVDEADLAAVDDDNGEQEGNDDASVCSDEYRAVLCIYDDDDNDGDDESETEGMFQYF